MSTNVEAKKIASQLRTLASDPEHQAFIVKDGSVVKGLMAFVNGSDPEVLVIALQALQFLSSHPSNKEKLSNEPGLLARLATHADSPQPVVAKLANSIIENLTSYINKEAEPKKAQAAFKPRYLYNIPMQIPYMVTEQQAESVEKALLACDGVVSVTMDRANREVTAYSSLPDAQVTEKLLDAVTKLGLKAEVGQGQDRGVQAPDDSPVKKPFGINNSQNRAAPSYMSKPNKAAGIGGVAQGGAPGYLNPGYAAKGRTGGMVAYQGFAENSLEARLKKRQAKLAEQKKKEEAAKSWVGSVTSYFW